MISVSRLGLSAMLLGGALANAQTISGPGTFPQFRDMNGLSGNGFAVMRDGELSLNGALTLSTPIAYLPRPGKTIIGVSSRSHDLRPRLPETRGFGGNSPSDGTAQILTGWDWGNVRFLGTHQIVSSAGDNVNNLQMMYRDPDRRFGDWTFSFGIHNILNRPSAAGDSFPDEDDQMSLSYFFVGTKECSREAYFSFGLGVFGIRAPSARTRRCSMIPSVGTSSTTASTGTTASPPSRASLASNFSSKWELFAATTSPGR